MNQFKGTKSDWKTYKPDHIGCINVSIGEHNGFNGYVELWHHHFKNKEEAEANAKLIATAPELLEACQTAYNFLKNGNQHETIIGKQLLATIEKATL